MHRHRQACGSRAPLALRSSRPNWWAASGVHRYRWRDQFRSGRDRGSAASFRDAAIAVRRGGAGNGLYEGAALLAAWPLQPRRAFTLNVECALAQGCPKAGPSAEHLALVVQPKGATGHHEATDLDSAHRWAVARRRAAAPAWCESGRLTHELTHSYELSSGGATMTSSSACRPTATTRLGSPEIAPKVSATCCRACLNASPREKPNPSEL